MLRVGGSSPAGRATGERAFRRAATEDLDRQLERSLERLSVSLQRIERLLSELQGERRAQFAASDERAYSQRAAAAAPAEQPGPRTAEAKTRAAGAETGAAERESRAAEGESRAAEAEPPGMQPQNAAVEPALRGAESRASASAPEAPVRVIHGSGRSAFDSRLDPAEGR